MATNITEVTLRDYGGFNPERCKALEEEFDLDCKSGETETELETTFYYPVGLLAAKSLFGEGIVNGDKITSYLRPTANNGKIGTVNGTHAAGSTEIAVSTELTEDCLHAGNIVLFSHSTEYHILSYSQETEALTLCSGLTQEVSGGEDILFRVYSAKGPNGGLTVKPEHFELGTKTWGCRILHVGNSLIIKYKHKYELTEDKKIPFVLVYYYGELES